MNWTSCEPYKNFLFLHNFVVILILRALFFFLLCSTCFSGTANVVYVQCCCFGGEMPLLLVFRYSLYKTIMIWYPTTMNIDEHDM